MTTFEWWLIGEIVVGLAIVLYIFHCEKRGMAKSVGVCTECWHEGVELYKSDKSGKKVCVKCVRKLDNEDVKGEGNDLGCKQKPYNARLSGSTNCKHLEVISYKSFDPHKGYTTEYECKVCGALMRYKGGNFFAYHEEEDDVQRVKI